MHAEGLWAAGSATTADALELHDCTTADEDRSLIDRGVGGSRSTTATVSSDSSDTAMSCARVSCDLSVALDASDAVDMTTEPPSFTLSQSGTFVKEDFVINRQGIAAVNGNEVAGLGLRLSDLEMLEILGQGASSLVRKARHKPSQTDLAVKIINVFDKCKRDQLLRELRTLYSAAFPWLVTFHDCLYDDGAMYIVLEYMEGGSLADVLHVAQITGSGPLSELVIGKLAGRVLASLNYLHRERHQVHRDMKPGNILLNSRGEIKISDFGLSAELDSTKEMCATLCATAWLALLHRLHTCDEHHLCSQHRDSCIHVAGTSWWQTVFFCV
mmetsp:Transcript_87967/g.264575  ORF Transcript_87967/g.264575 Transcript_87967/m.264575 type:complete len:328 (-) Transcript_87967:3345-4328(-)